MKQHGAPSKEIYMNCTSQYQGRWPLLGKLSRSGMLSLILLTFFVQIAFAQEALPVLCGTLDENDCEILKNSQEAMQSLPSATSQIEMHMSATNVPEIPGELAVDILMDASYEASPEIIQIFLEMQQNLPELMADEEALLGMYAQLLGGISQDLQIRMELSPDLIELLDVDEIPLENGISFHMLIADSVIYMDMSSLGDMIPELAMFRGWMGVDLSGITEILADELEQNPDLFATDLAQAEQDPVTLAMSAGMAAGYRVALENPELLESAVEILRLDDEVIQKTEVAVFQTDIDYAALSGDPNFLKAIISEIINQMEASGLPKSELPSSTEMSEIMVGIQMTAPSVLKDLNLTAIQLIGLEDFYTYGTEIYFDWDLSSVMMFAEMQTGGNIDSSSEEAPLITFDVITTYSNFNDIPEIVGPEGAVVLSLEMLMQLAEMQ